MALPASRNTTYAPGSPIKSADLNDVQDKIIALWLAGTSGLRTKIVNPELFAYQSGFACDSTWPTAKLFASAAGVLYVPLPLEVGDRLYTVNVVCAAAAVVTNINASLRHVNAAVGGAATAAETTLVAATNLPAAVATIQKIALVAGAPHVVLADRHYYVRINGANSAGDKFVHRVDFTYDRGA